jgi:DNA-binding NarL/FixJ family response regulator
VELAKDDIGAERYARSDIASDIFLGEASSDKSGGYGLLYLDQNARATVLIDHRVLVRECLHRGLLDGQLKGSVDVFQNVDEFLAAELIARRATLVVLSTGDRRPAEIKKDWTRIVSLLGRGLPVVLLAEEEKAGFIIEALEDGIRGYIPTSVSLGVAVEAIELVRAGGTFIPARSFLQGSKAAAVKHPGTGRTYFTERQAEVVAALRKGTSNKIIAHDLKMAQSTVKVHVSNIMRNLKAQNRTHVAFLLSQQDTVHW